MDLIPVANDREIHVSSQKMMKSKAFRAMLSPSFSEGHALRNKHSEKPVKITLPDDDCEPLVALYSVLHGQEQCLRCTKRDSSYVLDFAIAVDKYDCQGLVTRAQTVLLCNIAPPSFFDSDLLYAMYLLDAYDHFEKYIARLSMEVDRVILKMCTTVQYSRSGVREELLSLG